MDSGVCEKFGWVADVKSSGVGHPYIHFTFEATHRFKSQCNFGAFLVINSNFKSPGLGIHVKFPRNKAD